MIMRAMGWSQDMADAVASYVSQESLFSPKADSGQAHGLFQWDATRWAALRAWALGPGHVDPDTAAGQVAMFRHEIENNPRLQAMVRQMAEMVARGDVVGANELFLKVFGAGLDPGSTRETQNWNAEQRRLHSEGLTRLHNIPPAPPPARSSWNMGGVHQSLAFNLEYGPTAHATASAVQDRLDMAREALIRDLAGSILA
jgi:hypothetical protein